MANHLWQSTVFAIAAWVVTLAFRRNRAEVRFWLWFAASAKFLIPFAPLIEAGRRFAWPAIAVIAQSTVGNSISVASQPFSQQSLDWFPLPQSATAAMPAAWLWSALAMLWITGSLLMLFAWFVRWSGISAIAAQASPINAGREVQILRRLERRSHISRSIELWRFAGPLEPGG